MMFYQMISYSSMALWVQTYNLFSAKPVKSEVEARKIGEYVAHKLYDGTDLVDFSKNEEIPKISDNGGTYTISYSLLPVKYTLPAHVPISEVESRERCVTPLGGGGPSIKIEKSTGKILGWKLQK